MTEPVRRSGFTRCDLVQHFAERGYRTGAEIGVRQGAFSLVMCQTIPELELLCVDPWQYYPTNPKMYSQDRHDLNYHVACARLACYRVTLRKAFSVDAVKDVPMGSLDFVFLDGNHKYEFIRDDLAAWSLRVRSGGIVSGDDYDASGVKQATHEYVDAAGIDEWWLADDPGRRNRKGETFTSWWWVAQ